MALNWFQAVLYRLVQRGSNRAGAPGSCERDGQEQADKLEK